VARALTTLHVPSNPQPLDLSRGAVNPGPDRLKDATAKFEALLSRPRENRAAMKTSRALKTTATKFRRPGDFRFDKASCFAVHSGSGKDRIEQKQQSKRREKLLFHGQLQRNALRALRP
jgi:hypothetical protein